MSKKKPVPLHGSVRVKWSNARVTEAVVYAVFGFIVALRNDCKGGRGERRRTGWGVRMERTTAVFRTDESFCYFGRS